jgi:formylglycine-generating enzyme required for sulfatase activity
MKRSSVAVVVKSLGYALLFVLAAYVLIAFAVRKISRVPARDTSTEPIGSSLDSELAVPIEIRHVATGIEMRLVRPGEYMRGAPIDDTEASVVERPQHRVRLTRPFYLGVRELTQGQWKRVMGEEPVGDEAVRDGDDFPLHGARIGRVNAFLERTGLRLPTDAEWEYACRAGDVHPRYGSVHEIAWCNDLGWEVWDFRATIHPVGLKLPNAWGFHDMLGNVREYCSDVWPGGGGYEVQAGATLVDPDQSSSSLFEFSDLNVNALRGGCAASPANRCRASAVEALSSNGARYTGFRVARDA